jgi:hypothetical protein
MTALRFLVGAAGAFIVLGTVLSAIRTFVLPRAAPVLIGRIVFLGLRSLFNLFARPSRPYADRDRVMALYGPLALLTLATTWVLLVGTGYTMMYWAAGVSPFSEAVITSGSSLLTLGFVRPGSTSAVLLTFSEAALGLLLIALLITYLPVIYAAFTRREISVTLLEAFAGSPPSSSEFLPYPVGRQLAQLADVVCRRRREPHLDSRTVFLSVPAAGPVVGDRSGLHS